MRQGHRDLAGALPNRMTWAFGRRSATASCCSRAESGERNRQVPQVDRQDLRQGIVSHLWLDGFLPGAQQSLPKCLVGLGGRLTGPAEGTCFSLPKRTDSAPRFPLYKP